LQPNVVPGSGFSPGPVPWLLFRWLAWHDQPMTREAICIAEPTATGANVEIAVSAKA
jgi:hypothetical protein